MPRHSLEIDSGLLMQRYGAAGLIDGYLEGVGGEFVAGGLVAILVRRLLRQRERPAGRARPAPASLDPAIGTAGGTTLPRRGGADELAPSRLSGALQNSMRTPRPSWYLIATNGAAS